jgi:cytochrome b
MIAGLFAAPATAREDDEEENERGEAAEDLHEALSNLLLLLIAVHIGGVLWASYAHKENLAWSMVTGDKRKSA